MSDKLEIPSFQSEEEEANWWYDNREALSDRFVKAYQEGRVEVNGMARRLAAARGMPLIPLKFEDIPKAKAFAERRGMGVDSFLQLLVHEALEREGKLAS